MIKVVDRIFTSRQQRVIYLISSDFIHLTWYLILMMNSVGFLFIGIKKEEEKKKKEKKEEKKKKEKKEIMEGVNKERNVVPNLRWWWTMV